MSGRQLCAARLQFPGALGLSSQAAWKGKERQRLRGSGESLGFALLESLKVTEEGTGVMKHCFC